MSEGFVNFKCVTCGGTGEVDYRTYASGAATLEMNWRDNEGHYPPGKGVKCQECDGTGQRWRLKSPE